MFDNFCYYFLLFIIYSFMGWIMEIIDNIIVKHKIVNRGFLLGPYCPIYGFGCLSLIFFLSNYKSDPIILFFMAIVICSILEYTTSYIMEKLFKLRWWDYTDKKFNINGRICAETMIPFGLLGTLVICVINPFFESILNNIPTNILNNISIILFVIYFIDQLISISIIFGFKGKLITNEKDNTEEIKKKVKEVLKNGNYFHKRLINAFPNIISPRERLKKLQSKINNEIKKFKKHRFF